MKIKRVFLFVLDSLGIGAADDAADFGDEGANTLKRICDAGAKLPNLCALGLSKIDGVGYLTSALCTPHSALAARLEEASAGKDTTTGHWEIAGLVSRTSMPTYPDGFPAEIIEKFSKAVGRGVLVNMPYSGTDVIREYGEEHIKTGDLIVYTSADSVFQIAAHEDVVPLSELYQICECAREILVGEHAVGRVIARPFTGEAGSFKRTANRRDFSLTPPRKTLLDALSKEGYSVIGVGKISDIFAGAGITESFPTHSNREGMDKALELQDEDFEGLCFINLVDFDMLYGHRQDTEGYKRALEEFDAFLPEFIGNMEEDDLLIITADHGCDPGDDSTDHTREFVPFIMYNEKGIAAELGTRYSFATIAATIAEALEIPYKAEAGRSVWSYFISSI